MTIHIEDLNFECIIGLLDFEREIPQTLIINIEAEYNYKDSNFINYADMAVYIENLLKESSYFLLEEALLGLKILLFAQYPQIMRLYIKISKPDILKNCKVSLSKTWDF
jgi:dihydroneopterin aldolase